LSEDVLDLYDKELERVEIANETELDRRKQLEEQ
jgi:hypothetical protein